MKNFSFNLILVFAFLILFFSCKNSNQVKTSFRQKEFDQFFYQGQEDKAAGRNAEAILAFEKALNYKDEPTLHFEIAKLILESTGQDYSTTEKSLQDALEHIQKAVRTDQKNEWYNETLGQIYWAMGDEKDAL